MSMIVTKFPQGEMSREALTGLSTQFLSGCAFITGSALLISILSTLMFIGEQLQDGSGSQASVKTISLRLSRDRRGSSTR